MDNNSHQRHYNSNNSGYQSNRGHSNHRGRGRGGNSARGRGGNGAPRARPNYFFSTRINDAAIIKTVNEIQQHMRNSEPQLTLHDFQRPNTLHLTLGVFHAPNMETLGRVLEAFGECHPILEEFFKEHPVELEVTGIGQFGNHKVIWMGLQETENKKLLAQCVGKLRQAIQEKIPELEMEERDFNPHITLVKFRSRGGFPIVGEDIWGQYNGPIGKQHLSPFEILSMAEKDPDGYYKCYGRLNWDGTFENFHPDRLKNQ